MVKRGSRRLLESVMSLRAADDLGARDLVVVVTLGASSSSESEMCSTMSLALSTCRKVRPSQGPEDETVESTMFSTCGALGEKVQIGDLLTVGGVDS